MAGRIDSLDGARGVAALAVVAHHVYQQHWVGTVPAPVAHLMTWLGWWGVTFFFLLSGFCIHHPRARARLAGDLSFSRRTFLRDRFFRIGPAFLVVLFASGLVGVYAPSNLITAPHGWRDLLVHVFFVHNFFPESVFSINAVLWSLGIEMQFYVLYALLYRRLRFTWAENAAMLVIGIGWYIAASTLFAGEARMAAQRIFVVTFWMWHLGAVLAREFATRRPSARPWWFGLALVATLACSQVDPVVARLHVVYWLAPFAMAVLLWTWLPMRRAPSALHGMGMASYSLYLVHPIAIALTLGAGRAYGTLAGVALAMALAAVSYRWVELPGIALKKVRAVPPTTFLNVPTIPATGTVTPSSSSSASRKVA